MSDWQIESVLQALHNIARVLGLILLMLIGLIIGTWRSK